LFFFSRKRQHTRFSRDWSSDVCSSDLGDKELLRLLNQAVAALPEQLRIVFSLIKEQQLKSIVVAETLGISVRTVENQLYKAVKRSEEPREGKEDRYQSAHERGIIERRQ